MRPHKQTAWFRKPRHDSSMLCVIMEISRITALATRRFGVALAMLTLIVAGCFEVEDMNTPQSHFDFVSTPVRYQVVAEQVADGDMLPSEKTYSFETCLQDRITLSSMALNEFQIDGETVVSDEQGCVIWTKTVEFHPYAQSKSMEDKFVISSQGKYPGRLVIEYFLNPWSSAVRPTNTAEFVEKVHSPDGSGGGVFASGVPISTPPSPVIQNLSGDEDETKELLDSKKMARLKIASVVKQVFYHNELSLSDQIHLGLVLSPILQVFDASGSSHNIVPREGKVAVDLDILVLQKDLAVTPQNLKKAKNLKTLTFKDIEIESGAIKINEHIDAFQVLADENILLRLAILSPTRWGKDGLESPESMFFVRQSEESEVLQEANVGDTTSSFKEESVEIVSAQGEKHSFFFADNPRISHVENTSRTTTSIQYSLLFSTRLIHKNTESVVKNMDLYVTHDSKTQTVRVGPDGQIRFLFDFDYQMYTMQSRPQYLNFKISNTDGQIAVDVPLFLKPWDPSSEMSINPENLNDAKVASLKSRQWPNPQVFIEKLTLDTATPIEYKVANDLSLVIRQSYNMDAEVKVRSEGIEAFGGDRILPAPTGHYKLDVYLTCPKEGLVNRGLYNVKVDDSLETLSITRATQESDLKNLCPASQTSFDVQVEDGRAMGTFQILIPDPRMTWSRSQLTLILRPYKTTDLGGELTSSQKLQLSKSYDAVPVARVVILEDFASKSKSVALKTLNRIHEFGELASLEQVKETVQKWQIAYPYIAHLNSLESDYLKRNLAKYVSLDGHEYSTLDFPAAQITASAPLGFLSKSLVQTSAQPVLLERECDIESQECLKDTRDAGLSYEEFKSAFDEVRIGRFGELDITADELRDIVWNVPGHRLDDLVAYTCELWQRSYRLRLAEMRSARQIHPLSTRENMYLGHLTSLTRRFSFFARSCLHQFRIHPYSHAGHLSPVTAVHHLKGPVVAAYAEDAGVDILHFTQKNYSKLGHTLSFYSSAHVDLLGSFLKLIEGLGVFAGASGYSFTMMGEYEVVSGDDFSGGMNHYSNWTTVKMGLQFARPKYCLTLRLDPYYLFSLMKEVRDELGVDYDYLSAVDYKEGGYHSTLYRDLHRFLDLFESDVSNGYLICTEEQPPHLDKQQLATASDYPIHPDATTIGMEHYRFAGPRFNSDAIYDTTKESFRNWVYPLRGHADYLKFLHSMTDLRRNDVSSMHGYGNVFEYSSKLVSWFMQDDQVTKVNQHFHPTAREYVKFPKRYVYSRFSAVPPSIGGFYNY